MGGGAILKPVAGAVGAAIGGGPSHLVTNISRPTTNLQPSSSHLNLPVSANSSAPFSIPSTKSSGLGTDSSETCTRIESMDGKEDGKRARWASHHKFESVFGAVPSQTEVEKAMSDLQRFIVGLQTSEFDWLQHTLNLYDPRMSRFPGYGRAGDAFHLLQSDPSVQRLVNSISSDKAVWDAILNNKTVQNFWESHYPDKAMWNAILNNKTVQNFRESLCPAKEDRELQSQSCSEELDLATLIVKWILNMAKAMVAELIGKFSSLVNEVFEPPGKKEQASSENTDQLDDKLKSSLMLSILILLIVVVTRAQGA